MRKRSPSKGRRQQSPSCPSVAKATARPSGETATDSTRSSGLVPTGWEGSRNSAGTYLGVRTVAAPVNETATTAIPSLEGPTMTSLPLRGPLVDALPPDDATRTAAASTSNAIGFRLIAYTDSG